MNVIFQAAANAVEDDVTLCAVLAHILLIASLFGAAPHSSGADRCVCMRACMLLNAGNQSVGCQETAAQSMCACAQNDPVY